MTVSKMASKFYRAKKAACKGAWNWRSQWSKAMKKAVKKVTTGESKMENTYLAASLTKTGAKTMPNIKIKSNTYGEKTVIGKIDGRDVISIMVIDGKAKIVSSSCLPVDFDQAQRQIEVMQAAIEQAKAVDTSDLNEQVASDEIELSSRQRGKENKNETGITKKRT